MKAITARLPRTRGDTPMKSYPGGFLMLAPPHTRGYTRAATSPTRGSAGSPAHAGIHPRPHLRGAVRWRLPRTRGDTPAY